MRASTLLTRSLEPLLNALWAFFLVWTAIVAALWVAGEQWISVIANPGLRGAVAIVNGAADSMWLVLGAANLYLHLADSESLAKARVIGLSIGAAAVALAAASVWWAFPLGAVFFTTRLGAELGPVPLGWPLLWFIVVVGGREFAARIFPRASHGQLAISTGVFALLTDFNLEPIATKLRLYWFWYASGTHLSAAPSWRNYATWWVAASALAWLLREQRMTSARPESWRPALVPLIVNALLILGHARLAWVS